MKIRRFAAILLSLILIIGLFPLQTLAAERTPFGMIDRLELATDKQFVAHHRGALEALFEGMLAHQERINLYQFKIPLSHTNQEESLALIATAFEIYPELFFVNTKGGHMVLSVDGYLAAYEPAYIYSAAQAKTMLTAFYQKADEFLSMVDDSMDDFTKALILHDQLALHGSYAMQKNNVFSTNYTFMVEGWGRCENYAECYAYLLAQLGIKTEIVSSREMAHEWLRIRLDGSDYYYNIDLTWDDPMIVGDKDRPDKLGHYYFLLSDNEFKTLDPVTGRNQKHTGYQYIHPSDDAYDSYVNLHSLVNPLFYVDNKLYTIYRKNEKGILAIYHPADDSFSDILTIDDVWHQGNSSSSWRGNYSSIVEYDGMLYFNGENCVYVYDPSTGKRSTYINNAVSGTDKLYGLYVKNGKLIGIQGDKPNTAIKETTLGDCKKHPAVKLKDSYPHGAVTADTKRAFPGDTVSLTVIPDKGYEIDSVLMNNTRLTPDKDGKYSFKMPNGNAAISVTFALSDGVGAKLAGTSLSLQGDIGVNFYMELADEVIAHKDTAYMQFSLADGSDTVKKVFVNDARQKTMNGVNYYLFKCNVAASEMNLPIKAQFIDGSNKGTEHTYTVTDYAYYLLDNAYDSEGNVINAAYANAAELVTAMLNYGARSQTYFGSDDAPANTRLPAEKQRLAEVVADDIGKTSFTEQLGEDAEVTFMGATLSLQSETTLSFYFASDTALDFSCDGKTVEKAQVGGYQIARIRGISSGELGDDFTISVAGAEPTAAPIAYGSVTYSPMNYCSNALDNDQTSENLKEVIKALYLYSQAANQYFSFADQS